VNEINSCGEDGENHCSEMSRRVLFEVWLGSLLAGGGGKKPGSI